MSRVLLLLASVALISPLASASLRPVSSQSAMQSAVARSAAAIDPVISASLDAKYAGMLREARMADESMRNQLSAVFTIMQAALAALALTLAIILGLALKERLKIGGMYRAIAQHEKRFKAVVDAHSRELDHIIGDKLRQQIGRFWNRLKEESPLPLLADRVLITRQPELQTSVALSYEEFDRLVILADHLDAFEGYDKAADFLMGLAGYWSIAGRWPQAIARSKRAEMLRTDSGTVLNYGIGLCRQALALNDAKARRAILKQAAEKLRLAQDLSEGEPNLRAEILFRRGWVAEALDEHLEATEFYRKAIDLEERELEKTDNTYNLARALVRQGEYQLALDELAKVRREGDYALRAAEDPAFCENIPPEYQLQFRALVSGHHAA